MPRPIRATIDAGAMAHNLAIARRQAGGARVWAVVKANAYGHGLERAVKAFAGADGYALLDFIDALRLRNAGVTKPILMLEGIFKPADVALLARHSLTPVIHSLAQVEMLEKRVLDRPIDVYLKVNSGMNRLGFTVDSVRIAWNALQAHPAIKSVTIMTHFGDADGASGVAGQLEWFHSMTAALDGPRSLANSAALLRFPETCADWVRPGLMLYGCSPFPDRSAEEIGLRPAMTLASEIIAVQNLEPGERVGYGFSFEASAPMRIGIIACGYGDGYPRHAPSGTPLLVNAQRSCTVGRVSMDMICADITHLPDANIGTAVTLWGAGLSADEVAAAAGTLSYELLCALAARVPVSETT